MDFLCNFNLERYPFDEQRCFMAFRLRGSSRQEAVLTLSNVSYKGERHLVEYTVKNISGDSDFPCGEHTRCKLTDVNVHLMVAHTT